MFGLNATQACLVQRWHKEVGWYTTACSSGPAVNAHRLPWRHRGAQPISESDTLKPSVAARRPGQTKSCLVWQKSGSVRQSCTYQRCYGRNHRLWDHKHTRSCRCRLFSHEKYHPWILFRCSGSIHPNKTKSRGGIAYQSMHLCTLCKHDASCRLQSQQAPPVPGLQKKKKERQSSTNTEDKRVMQAPRRRELSAPVSKLGRRFCGASMAPGSHFPAQLSSISMQAQPPAEQPASHKDHLRRSRLESTCVQLWCAEVGHSDWNAVWTPTWL